VGYYKVITQCFRGIAKNARFFRKVNIKVAAIEMCIVRNERSSILSSFGQRCPRRRADIDGRFVGIKKGRKHTRVV
jgi:hypothetical protein